MDKLNQQIKALEKKLKGTHAAEIELQKMLEDKKETELIVNIINNMEERPKAILKRICIDNEDIQTVCKDLGLKPRQIYYSKKDAFKTLIDRLYEIKK